MDRQELGQAIYRASHLSGTFKLRSGAKSNEYFDKYLFESDPRLLGEIALHLRPLIPPDTAILAGLELGGVPVATALSLLTGLPQVLVRKEAKDYGTLKFAEGAPVAERNVCIVEDVVTTGGQIVKSADALRAAGARVRHVVCVIQRQESAAESLRMKELELMPLFRLKDGALS